MKNRARSLPKNEKIGQIRTGLLVPTLGQASTTDRESETDRLILFVIFQVLETSITVNYTDRRHGKEAFRICLLVCQNNLFSTQKFFGNKNCQIETITFSKCRKLEFQN